MTPEGLPQPLKIPTLEELKSKALNLASQNGIPTSVDDLKSKAIDLASQHGLPSVDELKSRAIEQVSKKIGGKELSRRKHKRSKWRTQRKLRR